MFISKQAGLNQILDQLGANLPEVKWMFLVDKNGIGKASFPGYLNDEDRIAAMSAAADALGGRITKELQGGELRYALFAGTLNVHLIMMLTDGYVLMTALCPRVSPGVVLQNLKEAISPLLEALKIDLPDTWFE
ncbi:MAG: roadblock/LC7 domain-containing protein [Anaerolineales bacterium]|nr:roadblock/LC7 domain-containing protein [Anaerolineales bacterium]